LTSEGFAFRAASTTVLSLAGIGLERRPASA
jgi:hypothetical protein